MPNNSNYYWIILSHTLLP
ncbi:unnamed protein product [Acanthoscelides obtectus]|uniref:Uncharacterized protein n=1 Tax=Acanthoscelides obtectus TaxID=200917 RepID=A0A9P0VQ94_ACAOB|nr:unnamed protein product [Acanthoscelides obtectus]CAH2017667.1 unnamed protein product [Acanthoscelides obtectus]CAH2020817.1 unnamed protein product [Acanthoscelides obtectus]CAK1682610.1 hypothetical protein AOBTE_LOCUS33727 [Acanthoscelides obtectus]CAK1682724.1 hypothetical protein AOBTE_LOCUS33828 [Acanthoscelides obtectus]